jgi:hypothetical protein
MLSLLLGTSSLRCLSTLTIVARISWAVYLPRYCLVSTHCQWAIGDGSIRTTSPVDSDLSLKCTSNSDYMTISRFSDCTTHSGSKRATILKIVSMLRHYNPALQYVGGASRLLGQHRSKSTRCAPQWLRKAKLIDLLVPAFALGYRAV